MTSHPTPPPTPHSIDNIVGMRAKASRGTSAAASHRASAAARYPRDNIASQSLVKGFSFDDVKKRHIYDQVDRQMNSSPSP